MANEGGPRQPQEWALEFIRNEPWYTDRSTGSPRYFGYWNEFSLDISGLERRADRFTSDPVRNLSLPVGIGTEELREYADKLLEMREEEQAKRCLDILKRLDENPAVAIEELNFALQFLVVKKGDEDYEDFRLPEFSFINSGRYARSFGELDLNKGSGKLVELAGIMLYLSDPPEVEYIKMAYKCYACGQDYVAFSKQKKCNWCGNEDKLEFLDGDSRNLSRNFQEGSLQEPIDDLSGSPATVNVKICGKLINNFTPGDRVKFLGYLKTEKVPRKSTRTYLVEAVNITLQDENRVLLTDRDRKDIQSFSTKPDPLAGLVDHFAPEIIGNRTAKEAIILQAVGGVKKDHGDISVRGKIHVLLAGDPGKAKSQLLKAAGSLVHKTIYASDASKAGLTVSVADAGKKKVLVPGVLVLASGGIARIDELDKMRPEDREGMHSAMEQGIVSKFKAGLRGTFKAEASVLAAANPAHGKFDLARNIPEQLKLEPTLLDRFDLIVWFLDRPQSREENKREALAILDPPERSDPEFLKKYLLVAAEINPVLMEEAKERLAECYAEIRDKSPDGISIGIRALHSIRKFSEACAKVRLSTVVNRMDVDRAVELLSKSWKELSFDTTRLRGAGHNIRKAMMAIYDWLRSANGRLSFTDIEKLAANEKFNTIEVSEAITLLMEERTIFEPVHGQFEVVSHEF